jgi:ubiquinol oxidase
VASKTSPDQDNSVTHYKPQTLSDKLAYFIVKFLRFFADAFFEKRYGHRAVVLETVAGVPGMVGGMLRHLKSLRTCKNDHGWIKILLDEAENERMHLMTFIEIAQPNGLERFLIVSAQFIFFIVYLMVYVMSPRTAHRIVGYLEEEAVISYTRYLKEIESGAIENIPAPPIAIRYWSLAEEARLYDLVLVIRSDEANHRDVNHTFSDQLTGERKNRT